MYAILPSTVLSQQCCEVHYISLPVVNLRMKLDYQVLLKSPPPLNVLAGSAPDCIAYSVFTPTRNARDVSIHRNGKEYTNT